MDPFEVTELSVYHRDGIKAAVLKKLKTQDFVELQVKCLEKHGGVFGGDDFFFDLFMMMAVKEHEKSNGGLNAEVARLQASLKATGEKLFDTKGRLAFYDDHKCDEMLCRICSDPIKILGEGPICKDCSSNPVKQPVAAVAGPTAAKELPVPKASVDTHEYLAMPGGSGTSGGAHRTTSSGEAVEGAGEMDFLKVELGMTGKAPLKGTRRSKLAAVEEIEMMSAVRKELKTNKKKKMAPKPVNKGKKPVKRALFEDDYDDDDDFVPSKKPLERREDLDGMGDVFPDSIPWASEVNEADKKAIVKALGFDALMIEKQRKAILAFNRSKDKMKDASDDSDCVFEPAPPIKRKNAYYDYKTSGAYLEEQKKLMKKAKKGKEDKASSFDDFSCDEDSSKMRKVEKEKVVEKMLEKEKFIESDDKADSEDESDFDTDCPPSGSDDGGDDTVDETVPPIAMDSQAEEDSQEII